MSQNLLANEPVDPFGTLDTPLASQELEDFVYLISHDVRSSVRALIELPQWIADDLADAGVRVEGSVAESIDLMNKHTGRLDRMLVDLLTFSRVGRMQTVRQIDLDDALTEVLEEKVLPPGFKTVRKLECHTLMIGDRDILTLLSALISNAVKHHDRQTGQVTFRTRVDRDEVVITLQDDGPGIPAKFHQRVFGAMTTLRPRDEVEGSGMGLAIIRKIALLYGGTATILDIAEPRGTTVEVRFPVSRAS